MRLDQRIGDQLAPREQRHVLTADRDLIAVRQRAFAVDAITIDSHAVPTAEVRQHHRFRRDGERRVRARDQRIVERELAIRCTTDHELPWRQVDIVIVVAKRMPHAPIGSELPRASIPAKLSRSSRRGPPREITLSTTRRAAGASEVRSDGGKVIKRRPTARGGTPPSDAYTESSHLPQVASRRMAANDAAASATASSIGRSTDMPLAIRCSMPSRACDKIRSISSKRPIDSARRRASTTRSKPQSREELGAPASVSSSLRSLEPQAGHSASSSGYGCPHSEQWQMKPVVRVPRPAPDGAPAQNTIS